MSKTANRIHHCSGVILAGGLSTRLAGKNKALLKIGDRTVIGRIYAVFRELFDEIILVTNEPLRYMDMDLIITTDIYPARSSLTGIHAGLFTAVHPHIFVTACDTPFLKPEIVKTVLDKIEDRFDVIIPETSNGIEPLCAAYGKQCLKPMERHLSRGDFKIRRMFNKLRVRTVSEKMLMAKDPELISFFNINTPEDLIRATGFYQ